MGFSAQVAASILSQALLDGGDADLLPRRDADGAPKSEARGCEARRATRRPRPTRRAPRAQSPRLFYVSKGPGRHRLPRVLRDLVAGRFECVAPVTRDKREPRWAGLSRLGSSAG